MRHENRPHASLFQKKEYCENSSNNNQVNTILGEYGNGWVEAIFYLGVYFGFVFVVG
jgi:hypothetical protein